MFTITGVFQWLFIVLGLSIWITYTSSKEIRVVCYYTNWSVYRPGTAKFSPQNINPYLCTHLVYAFGGFTKENTLKPFDKYQDIEKGGYAKFTGLKTYNKNLKTLLAIGGWNEASSRFSPMVASADRRKQLVKNSIKFLRQNHFDGLDLDWEYPAFREGGKPRDRDNYAKLVQELREEFERESEKTGRSRLLLTMAVPAGIEYVNKGYDIAKLTKYLDWMNILSYDYHSAFEPAVNHHAPLYPLQEATEYDYDVELNIDYTIKHYLELGADPSKLVVGIPTYGRSYTLFNPDANAMGDPADGPGEMGEATRENGYLAYYEICENIKSNDWTVIQPNEKAMGPYAFKENQWVGYDDENIVRRKAEYVAKNGLGGIMFWAIDNDDFRGNCHGRPYPLIEAGKEALMSSYGMTEDNLISPPSKPAISKNRHRTRPKTTEEPTNFEVSTKTSAPRRRNRIKTKASGRTSESDDRSKPRRKETRKEETSSTYSSLKVITPAYTTPEPPSTPDQGGAFKCEDEGFFPHPKDCKKYFWCLSGPGDLGTVAHQFTCPAGLYFNKAADSCDYSQNVLCNKKLSKTTTTTEGKKNTESTQKTTTTQRSTRAPSSRLTIRTTTEEPYDDDYEYEDDDVNDPKLEAEEDPRVIKELLNLIKKAGGIEELEKQLKIDNNKPENGATTPSTKTKSIVEKLLISRNNKNESTGKSRYSFTNRNSRGPQNEGLKERDGDLEKTAEHKVDRRPQYTSILRRRPSTPKAESEPNIDDIEDEEVEEKQTNPKYVSLRRNKDKATTENSINRDFLDRNKILGEEDKQSEDSNLKEITVHTTPHYVNIRRQRPSTSETSSTSKYVSIQRPTTTETPVKVDQKEPIIEKSDTTEPATTVTQEISTLRYKILNRHSTSTTGVTSTEMTPLSEALTATTPEPTSTVPSSTLTTASEKQSSVSVTVDSTSTVSSTQATSTQSERETTKSPVLFQPRPFSIESKPTISTTQKPLIPTLLRSTTSSSKVSDIPVRSRFRAKLNSDKNLNNRVFAGDDNSVELGSSEIIDNNRPSRTRSRYHRPDLLKNEAATHSPVRHRGRPISTEKIITHKEEDDYQRKYRPLTLDDLSSLTAADITIQESNRSVGFRRSRLRSTTADTSSESTTRESITSTTKKILNRSKSSYVSSNSFKRKNDIIDQVKSNTNEVSFNRPNQIDTVSTSTESNRRSPHRMRKVIRRLRTSTVHPTTPPNPVTHRGKPFSISSLNIHNTEFPEVSNIFVGDSESNEANYSEESAEEDENIKLSATNIRENSNTNIANAIFEPKYVRQNKHESLFEKSQYDSISRTTAEPSTQRTRKIIRRIRPTEATLAYTETSSPKVEWSTKRNFGRNKKVIRRFRPTSKNLSYKEDLNDKVENNSQRFITKASTSQFSDKRSQYLSRSRDKLSRKFTLKHLTTTQSIANSDSFLNLFNKFEEGLDNTEETQRDSSTRGRLKYVDIVRSTIPLMTSTEQYEDSTSSVEDDAASTIHPLFGETTTHEFKDVFTTSNFFITNEETSYVPDIRDNERTTNEIQNTVSESAEDLLSTVGNYEDVTISSTIFTDTDDVTTISYLQASSSTDASTEAESSTFDFTSSTIAPVSNTVSNMTNTGSLDNFTTLPSQSSSEATTQYIRRSTLRTAGLRPTYFIRRTTTPTSTAVPLDIKPTEVNQRSSFNRRKHVFRPKSTSESSVPSQNVPEKPKRKYSFNKYGRTASTLFDNLSKENINEESQSSRTSTKSRSKYLPNRNKTFGSTEPYQPEVTTEREEIQPTVNPNTIDSTLPDPTEIEKLRSRNKSLFFKKKRKMNIPTFLQPSSKEEQTTEYLTTLYHVFAETAVGENKTNTVTKNETHVNTGGNIERVVEINRIVNVHVKNGDNNSSLANGDSTGILDKIGAINRVTSIKVVDGNRTIDQTNQRLAVVHDIIEQELENERTTNHRKDRKFGINITDNTINGLNAAAAGADIIDGISHIKVITPRPIQLAEVSTIALEGLFTRDSAKTEYTEDPIDENTTTVSENELLDADYSRFVNIRVLKPEEERSLGGAPPADTPRVVRIIPNNEDVTMKAQVVEVTPKHSNQTIRIAPIQVAMSRAIADVPVIGLSKLNEKISNTPFRPTVDSGVP